MQDKFENFTHWLEGFIDRKKGEGLSSEECKEIKDEIFKAKNSITFVSLGSNTTGSSNTELITSGYAHTDQELFYSLNYVKIHGLTEDEKLSRTTFGKLYKGEVLMAERDGEFMYLALEGFSKDDGFAIFRKIDNSTANVTEFLTPGLLVQVAGRNYRLSSMNEIEETNILDEVDFKERRRNSTRKKVVTNFTKKPELNDEQQQMVNKVAGLATMEDLERFHKEND